MRSIYFVFVVLFGTVALVHEGRAEVETLTVFIVRHAEKANTSRDAELTPVGQQRAEHLARVLKDAEIGTVHSTNFRRTWATADPSATAFDTIISAYDPRDLSALVAQIRQSKGRHLVVGHTTTIPKTIKLLGGDPGLPIDEAREYDRLYIVTIGKTGDVSTLLLRY